MRATAVVALLLHALPGAHGAANATFVRGPDRHVTYDEAAAFCTQIGATIASIHSAAENELARTACGGLVCWLGLVEYGGDAGTAAASQAWRWQDPPASQAAIPAYTNWAAGAPDNAGGDQRNAIIDTAAVPASPPVSARPSQHALLPQAVRASSFSAALWMDAIAAPICVQRAAASA